MLLAWVLNALALAFGAGLGLRGLIDPHWAARFVRLKADEQGGGFAEFRATYGGVFLGLHGFGLLLSLYWMLARPPSLGAAAAGASLVVAAGWGGAAFGRLVSIWRDEGANTRFNRLSAAVETLMALLIGAPWVVWLFAG